MARVSGPTLTQDQSRCGVCEQLLRDPVIITCGHSFCRQCISSYWSQSGPSGDYSCPRCPGQHSAQCQPPGVQGSPGPAPLVSSIVTASGGGTICNSTLAGCQFNGPVTFNTQTQSTAAEGRSWSDWDQDEALRKFLDKHKTKMKERYECIFEGIETKANRKLLNKIYTEVYITEVEGEGLDSEHEVWQLETAFKRQSAHNMPINCNDIFEPLPGEEEKKNIRVVLTKGVAGIGKTVSVQKFVLDWAEGKANPNIRFMFVFPFRVLNSIKEDHSLQNLLLGFHPELKSLEAADKYYDGDRTILIFDGLDESRLPLDFQGNETVFDVSKVLPLDALITNLIEGNLLSSALVWITSRPVTASKIPTKYVDQLTEVRGFSEAQKEEYFRKRCEDTAQAEKIIAHVKASRSLQIMCHIPVFCWIAATVFQQMLKRTKGNNDEIPKTLTQMYVHFLLIQTSIKDQKYHRGHGEGDREGLLVSHKEAVLKLAELAYKQTMKGNVTFYKEDLTECGIDVSEASVYSGMCTEIFKEESVFYQQKVYCFVHLSIQEFLAAFHAFVAHANGNFEELKPLLRERGSKVSGKNELTLERFLKETLYTALNSKNGNLDLFLRFLLGISLESNQKLLQGLLLKQQKSAETIDHMIQYIRTYKGKGLPPERCINLFHCLVEMNDQSMHREILEYLQSEGSRKQLSPSFCSSLAHVLLMSEEVLDELDLRRYNASSDEGRRRLVPAVRCCRKALFAACNLNEASCEIVASALQSADSHLVELDLSRNNLQDAGANSLFVAMLSPHCKLQILRIPECLVTQQSCGSLCLALQSPHSLLRELDMSTNALTDSGLKLICKGLKSPHSKLHTLRLAGCGLTDAACRDLGAVLRFPGSVLGELDLTDNDLRDLGAKFLSAGLGSSKCQLEILRLLGCLISEEGCLSLALALGRNPSGLLELDLSYNHPGAAGEELLALTRIDLGPRLRLINVDHGAAYRLRSGLRKYACQLTLDPNTAHRKLVLSEGDRSVACTMRDQPYPDHPERFSTWQVLCREPQSGRSYWEVERGGWYGVVVGASYKVASSSRSEDDDKIGYNDWSWSLACYDNRYTARHSKRRTEIPAPVLNVCRMAVYLNWPAGTLSFFSVSGDALTHLHTFYSRFSEPLYPALRFIFAGSSASICELI